MGFVKDRANVSINLTTGNSVSLSVRAPAQIGPGHVAETTFAASHGHSSARVTAAGWLWYDWWEELEGRPLTLRLVREGGQGEWKIFFHDYEEENGAIAARFEFVLDEEDAETIGSLDGASAKVTWELDE